jgi:hypothetical protein
MFKHLNKIILILGTSFLSLGVFGQNIHLGDTAFANSAVLNSVKINGVRYTTLTDSAGVRTLLQTKTYTKLTAPKLYLNSTRYIQLDPVTAGLQLAVINPTTYPSLNPVFIGEAMSNSSYSTSLRLGILSLYSSNDTTPTTPIEGMLKYKLSYKRPIVYNGTAWKSLAYTDDIPSSVVLNSNIYEWDADSGYYRPYTSLSSGLKWYTGTSNPNGTTRLNLNGYLYATRLYSNAVQVPTTVSSTLVNATLSSGNIAIEVATDSTGKDIYSGTQTPTDLTRVNINRSVHATKLFIGETEVTNSGGATPYDAPSQLSVWSGHPDSTAAFWKPLVKDTIPGNNKEVTRLDQYGRVVNIGTIDTIKFQNGNAGVLAGGQVFADSARIEKGIAATSITAIYATFTYINVPVGTQVTAAGTITPTGRIFHITGGTQINTINLPFVGFKGKITIITDSAINLGTSGNIFTEITLTQSRAVDLTFDGTKWYMEY